MERTLPNHIAVIMDGNGRWAGLRGLPRSKGHLAGVDAVRELIRESRKLGIPYVTVYAFSRENWQRPEGEVGFLFELFLRFIRQELPELMEQDIRLSFIGEKGDLPFAVRQALEHAVRKTAGNRSLVFTLAISYAGEKKSFRPPERPSAPDCARKNSRKNASAVFCTPPTCPTPISSYVPAAKNA